MRSSLHVSLIEDLADEALRHWRACEEGWNKTIRITEQVIDENNKLRQENDDLLAGRAPKYFAYRRIWMERDEAQRLLKYVYGYLYRTPRTTANGASIYDAIEDLLGVMGEEDPL